MSAPELMHRVMQACTTTAEWIAYAIDRDHFTIDTHHRHAARSILQRDDTSILPLLRPKERASAARQKDIARATIIEADAVLEGRWRLFGDEVELGLHPEWDRDPFGQRRWPHRFYAALDYRGGGAKFVWEASRHLPVAALARAYVWTGHAPYAHHASALLTNWVAANPPLQGIHWTSPIECALRLIAWTLIVHATRHSGAWDESRLAAIIASVDAQARFIERHPSRFSSANNHRLAELAGLIVTGVGFPTLPNAPRWRARGLVEFSTELGLQVFPDGVGAEQAPYYEACALDYGSLIVALIRERGDAVPAIIIDRLSSGARFLERLGATSWIPAIGDSDDGRAIPLDAWNTNAHDMARLGVWAVLPSANELRRMGEKPTERLAWLGGLSALDRWKDASPSAPAPSSELFPRGGYAIIVAGATRVIMDVGPLGYRELAAHGHADALSLTLDLDGDPVLIDPGTYLYHEAPDWRRYFRGTSAHNTVVVAGMDQSEPLGDTIWGRKAVATLEGSESGGIVQWVDAHHDGYRSRGLGILHRRLVICVGDDYVVILDQLRGDVRDSELLWHFPADALAAPQLGGLRVRTAGGTERFMTVQSDAEMLSRLSVGETSPPQGWVSPRFGVRMPAPVWKVSARARWYATVVSRAVMTLTLRRLDEGIILRIVGAGVTDWILIPETPGERLVTETVDVSGRFAVIRERESRVTGLYVGEGRALAGTSIQSWASRSLAAESHSHGEFAIP